MRTLDDRKIILILLTINILFIFTLENVLKPLYKRLSLCDSTVTVRMV